MEPTEDDELAAAEALLLRLRPDLDATARDRIERGIFGTSRRGVHPRRGRLRLGAGLATGLAALLLVFAVVGAQPFATRENVVLAAPDCQWVGQPTRTGQPRIATTPAGGTRLQIAPVVVNRLALRCR